jgi:hypothetical protein
VGPRPVFLLSISRSGSTLVQRVMAAHECVETVSEPWLLLPLAYTLRRRGVDAEYLHGQMVEAIDDFAQTLPGGKAEYRATLADFAVGLYERAASPGTTHFLDKSPPYNLVAQEILDLFPHGRFVFLWRNPLSVAASMIETWGPWRPTMFREDLFVGLPRLVDAYARNAERVHAVRYEDLIAGSRGPWEALMDYVGVAFDPRALSSFAQVTLNGKMGDRTGAARYATVSTEPLEKWRATFASPLRREWARRYVRVLGAERLRTMGYDLGKIEAQLDALPRSFAGSGKDALRLLEDLAKEPIRVRTRHRRVGSPHAIRRLIAAGRSAKAPSA